MPLFQTNRQMVWEPGLNGPTARAGYRRVEKGVIAGRATHHPFDEVKGVSRRLFSGVRPLVVAVGQPVGL